MTETFFEKCKMNFAILFFICVVYPVKYVIHPILKIIYENIYLFFALFVMWVNFTIAGSPAEANRMLSAKLRANPTSVSWIVEPIVTIFGYDITPMMALTILITLLMVYKMYDVFMEAWGTLKMWAGHIMMISLWGWYTLIGNKEKSLMVLRNPDEQRSLLIFYGIVILVIVAVIGLMFVQNILSDTMLTAFNFTTGTNEMINTSANETIIPINITMGEIEHVENTII